MSTRTLYLTALLLAWTALPAIAQTYVPQMGQQSLSNSSYVIDKNGKLWAWGANESGELGIGNTTDQNAPVQIAIPLGAGGWVRVAGGAHHALAVADSDRLYAWGSNRDGQLGDGSTSDRSSPIRVTNPSGVTFWRWVSAGDDHSIALANNGVLYAWGNNERGQLGTGDGVSYRTPHLVPMPSGVHSWTAVAAGDGFTIAVTDVGELYAWGYDSTGAWGSQGINQPTKLGTGMMGAAWLPDVAANANLFSSIRYDGTTSTLLTSSRDSVIAVTLGVGHIVCLRRDGSLFAEGDNLYGQLGSSDIHRTENLLPFPEGVSQWVAVAAGRRHTIALANDGNVYAWGDNAHGQLGTSNNQMFTEPQLVRQFTDRLQFAGQVQYNSLTVNATIRDTTSASLVAPVGVLTVPFPMKIVGSMRTEFAPYTLGLGDVGTASWTVSIDSSIPFAGTLSCYAYIYAHGTAPRVVPLMLKLDLGNGPHRLVVRVIDSLTHMPVAGAIVHYLTPNRTTTTSANGTDTLITAEQSILGFLKAENHRTTPFGFSGTSDTVFTVALPPSQLVGAWAATHAAALERVYATDSVNLWALRAHELLRSVDGGNTWQSVASSVDSLRAIAMVSDSLGYAVGYRGQILRIRDGVASMETMVGTTQNLLDISVRNGAVWVLADSGLVLHRTNGGWIHEQAPITDGTRIYALGTDSCIVLSDRVLEKRTSAGWTAFHVGLSGENNADLSLLSPRSMYYVTTYGRLREANPSDTNRMSSSLGFAGTGSTWLRFSNEFVGLVGGAFGAAVTYDSAISFVPLRGATGPTSSADLAGLHAFFISGDSLVRYTFTAGPTSGVITGRFLLADSITGVAGGTAVLHGTDGFDHVAYTTDKGYYVLTDVPLAANQSLDMSMSDSDGVWTRQATVSTVAAREIRINFIRPHTASVEEGLAAGTLKVRCTESRSSMILFEMSGTGASTTVELVDVLGRVLSSRTSRSNSVVFERQQLAPGVYFGRAMSDGQTAICRFAVE